MDTSGNDLVDEFFEPLLARAVRYDRGVGFFASSWLRINARGTLAFAQRGGRAGHDLQAPTDLASDIPKNPTCH
jgi:hypothetical protein